MSDIFDRIPYQSCSLEPCYGGQRRLCVGLTVDLKRSDRLAVHLYHYIERSLCFAGLDAGSLLLTVHLEGADV